MSSQNHFDNVRNVRNFITIVGAVGQYDAMEIEILVMEGQFGTLISQVSEKDGQSPFFAGDEIVLEYDSGRRIESPEELFNVLSLARGRTTDLSLGVVRSGELITINLSVNCLY